MTAESLDHIKGKTEDPGAHQNSPGKLWDRRKPHKKLGGLLQDVCRAWEHTRELGGTPKYKQRALLPTTGAIRHVVRLRVAYGTSAGSPSLCAKPIYLLALPLGAQHFTPDIPGGCREQTQERPGDLSQSWRGPGCPPDDGQCHQQPRAYTVMQQKFPAAL